MTICFENIYAPSHMLSSLNYLTMTWSQYHHPHIISHAEPT